MRGSIAWAVMLVALLWLGPVVIMSGRVSFAGYVPDLFLGAVVYFHLAGRMMEMHKAAIISILLVSIVASAGGSIPAGARLAGYALTLLVAPPADDLHRRPLFLAAGLFFREIVVLVCGAVVLGVGGSHGHLPLNECIVTVLATVPAAFGVFYALVGIGRLLGLRLEQRRFSRPDTLADASAFERVLSRADIREV
ncbi:MAG: hypothetical protein JW909_07815 [Planctomycetes bacterium]|nr:hypothetical protein [Planctomycetota bacterium]